MRKAAGFPTAFLGRLSYEKLLNVKNICSIKKVRLTCFDDISIYGKCDKRMDSLLNNSEKKIN